MIMRGKSLNWKVKLLFTCTIHTGCSVSQKKNKIKRVQIKKKHKIQREESGGGGELSKVKQKQVDNLPFI